MPSTAEKSITEHAIRSNLKTEVFGRGVIEIYEQIASINIKAKELALRGAREGTLVLAESQTAGRGRLGRSWHSPSGVNIYLSLILRPEFSHAKAPLLTLAAGLAGLKAIDCVTGQTPAIKWPNDLLLQNRKIAGILAEMDIKDSRVSYIVLGIGINVNLSEQDLPADLITRAGSLFIATGQKWNRVEILTAFLYELEKYYQALCQEHYEEILTPYRQACQTLRSRVRFVQQGKIIEGRAIDVGQSGNLIVERKADGEIVTLRAGEVSSLPTSNDNLNFNWQRGS